MVEEDLDKVEIEVDGDSELKASMTLSMTHALNARAEQVNILVI